MTLVIVLLVSSLSCGGVSSTDRHAGVAEGAHATSQASSIVPTDEPPESTERTPIPIAALEVRSTSEVRLTQIERSGGPVPDAVRSAVTALVPEVRRCHQAQLDDDPMAEGDFGLGFMVDEFGRVDRATVTGVAVVTDVARECALALVGGLRFRGRGIQGVYTANFATTAVPEVGELAVLPAFDVEVETRLVREADGSTSAPLNPRSLRAILADCYARILPSDPSRAGSVVFRLRIAEPSRITSVEVLDDALGFDWVLACAARGFTRGRSDDGAPTTAYRLEARLSSRGLRPYGEDLDTAPRRGRERARVVVGEAAHESGDTVDGLRLALARGAIEHWLHGCYFEHLGRDDDFEAEVVLEVEIDAAGGVAETRSTPALPRRLARCAEEAIGRMPFGAAERGTARYGFPARFAYAP